MRRQRNYSLRCGKASAARAGQLHSHPAHHILAALRTSRPQGTTRPLAATQHLQTSRKLVRHRWKQGGPCRVPVLRAICIKACMSVLSRTTVLLSKPLCIRWEREQCFPRWLCSVCPTARLGKQGGKEPDPTQLVPSQPQKVSQQPLESYHQVILSNQIRKEMAAEGPADRRLGVSYLESWLGVKITQTL